MKLVCLLKTQNTIKPFLLHESDSLEELKLRAVEYAQTNPSFRHSWETSDDESRQRLSIDFDYHLEIQA